MLENINKKVLEIISDHERGIHPYGIMKALDGQGQISISAIYNACARLENEGCIQIADSKSIVNEKVF